MTIAHTKAQTKYQASRRGLKCYFGGCEEAIHKGGRCQTHYIKMLCQLKDSRQKKKRLQAEFKASITQEKT